MPKTAYTIRLATAAEVPLLGPLHLAAKQRFPVSVLPEPWRSTRTLPVSVLEEGLGNRALWVALDKGGELAGYVLLLETPDAVFLHQVDVLPEHGRRGLGRSLVAAAMERARELGYAYLYLTTFAAIPWNAPFYARLGFAVVPDDALPPGVLETLMEERAAAEGRVAMRISL